MYSKIRTEILFSHGRGPHGQIVLSFLSSLEIMKSLASVIGSVKRFISRISSSLTPVGSHHTENSTLAYMLQQLRMPLIGQNSGRVAVGMVQTAVVQVRVRAAAGATTKTMAEAKSQSRAEAEGQKRAAARKKAVVHIRAPWTLPAAVTLSCCISDMVFTIHPLLPLLFAPVQMEKPL